MAQVFSPAATLVVKLVLIALVALVAVGVIVARWRVSGVAALNAMPAQPIPFSHKHHVADDGIDCRYCHTSVERARFAGMPSSEICLTCHSQLFVDAPVLKPLHESARTGKPIRWVRVHDLPDFVFFDHSIHIHKGVGCVECHGRVDQMPLMSRVSPLTMQWCLACHRDPGPHLREPELVFAMTATPARSRAEQARLSASYHIQSTRRLTDCSTCHR